MINLRPLAAALATCALIVAAGLVSLVLGTRVVARTVNVADQVPAMVSGGIGGLALVLTGCTLALVQVGRACAESERRANQELLDTLALRQSALEAGAIDEPDATVIDIQDTREFRRMTS